MNTVIKAAAACAVLAVMPALAEHTADHCGNGAAAEGMRARVDAINDQMDRIEWTTDRAQQRELMDLHMKHMREGLRELRKREMPAACRIDLMSAMVESMVRSQLVAHSDAR